jgi:hypothetical protein
MPGIEIKGRSKIANYRHGGRTGKFGGGRTNLLEQLGRVEAEPSNPNRRAEISRVHGELNRGYAKGGRAGHFVGGVIKKVISKLKPKPKGKVDQKFLDFIKTGKHIDKEGTKVNLPKVVERLKKQGSPGIETYEESVKKGKAAGGRIGKKWGKIVRPIRSKLHEVLGGGVKGKPHSTKEGRQASGKRLLRRTYEAAKEHVKSKGPPSGRAEGGRIGFKKGTDKKWIQKAVNPKHKGYCTPMTKKTCTPARKALARTFKKKAKTGWG